ncbi:MAG TPA: N-6 DNA methylase, partial [Gemmataceae bacterium]|nr:N-6 DNA methylase [Gemmataceae bacterium]
TLGSLIDPTRFLEKGEDAGLDRVLPLIEEALAQEQSEEARELAIAAQGVLAAFRILASRFTLVATNVPYLGRGKQDPVLAQYCAEFHSDAKADLATCFVERCLRFARDGGSVALVTPQNWLFLTSYKRLREWLLANCQWDFVLRLGPRAFEMVSGEVVNVSLLGLTHKRLRAGHQIVCLDVSEATDAAEKAAQIRASTYSSVSQTEQLRNPDARITLTTIASSALLGSIAEAFHGQGTFDSPRFSACFWELPQLAAMWVPQQSTPSVTQPFDGCHYALRWESGNGALAELMLLKGQEGYTSGKWKAGVNRWGSPGVIVGQMGDLPATLYLGFAFDENASVVMPNNADDLPALWSFVTSPQFRLAISNVDQSIKVTCKTLVKIPFDRVYWQAAAAENYPEGLPKPHSDDPTQWLFNGHPKGSDHPLQVAVARLVGYRWPRQTGSSFPDCPALSPDGLEAHADADGIVPLASIAGEASAADRLRALLKDAYGEEWSAAKLKELLGEWDSLEDWLRDGFFEEHCRIFHQRPFVWHIWDGRKDGFHALVNYHRLAAPNGEGRQTLEKLIYTYLGRWIERQQDEVKAGKEGADARLTAALHLKAELEKILEGEKPYDIFVRWKPLHEQPIGWEPDINDGVRLNIRPWLQTTLAPVTKPKKGACILRATPKIHYGKDRGKEPHRAKEDFPWFWSWDQRSDDFMGGDAFDGARWNDLHYSLNRKKTAREKKKAAEATIA